MPKVVLFHPSDKVVGGQEVWSFATSIFAMVQRLVLLLNLRALCVTCMSILVWMSIPMRRFLHHLQIYFSVRPSGCLEMKLSRFPSGWGPTTGSCKRRNNPLMAYL